MCAAEMCALHWSTHAIPGSCMNRCEHLVVSSTQYRYVLGTSDGCSADLEKSREEGIHRRSNDIWARSFNFSGIVFMVVFSSRLKKYCNQMGGLLIKTA